MTLKVNPVEPRMAPTIKPTGPSRNNPIALPQQAPEMGMIAQLATRVIAGSAPKAAKGTTTSAVAIIIRPMENCQRVCLKAAYDASGFIEILPASNRVLLTRGQLTVQSVSAS